MKRIDLKYYKLHPLIIIALLLMPTIGYTQGSRKTTEQIEAYISAAKANKDKPDISKLLDNNKKHDDVLSAVKRHYSDTVYDGAITAYKITYDVARKSNVANTRQNAVEAICSGIQNSNRSVVAWCIRHLSVFYRTDFNNNAKSIIANNLQIGTPKLDELVLVAGYLNLSESASKIESLANLTKKTSEKWAVWLALARMGNDKYINNVAETARMQTLNDDVVYEIVPGLIYTRKKPAIDVAIEILFNDQKKCYSSSPDNPVKIFCGYRVMEYLAPVIKDFPYGVKTSGDIDTDNYEKALTEVQKWFLEKGDSYEVLDNAF